MIALQMGNVAISMRYAKKRLLLLTCISLNTLDMKRG